MSWKERNKNRSYLAPKTEPHMVAGETINFAAVSLPMLTKLRVFATPIATLFAALWQDNKRDSGTISRNVVPDNPVILDLPNGGTTVTTDSEVVMQAITPELAKTRYDLRTKAVTAFFEAITEDTAIGVIGEIVMDSMIDDFPRTESKPHVGEFLSSVGLPTLLEMCVGVAKANKGQFSPLLKSLGLDIDMAQVTNIVNQKVSSALNQQTKTEPTQNGQQESESETPGQSSQTKSPGSSNAST